MVRDMLVRSDGFESRILVMSTEVLSLLQVGFMVVKSLLMVGSKVQVAGSSLLVEPKVVGFKVQVARSFLLVEP